MSIASFFSSRQNPFFGSMDTYVGAMASRADYAGLTDVTSRSITIWN